MSGLRILLVSKFYRRGGGDCVHLLALERLLRSKGHEVAVFTMSHPDNLPLSPGSFEAPRVVIDGSPVQKLRAAARVLGAGGVVAVARKAMREFRPDIVHLHNIHSYLSPAVAVEAHKAGARVVWTLHDYKLLCPAYSFRRSGAVCEECLGNPLPVVRTRCMKGSLAASALAYLEARKWNRGLLESVTDVFVCPSAFMRNMMMRGGFSESKLRVLGNFLPEEMPDCDSNRRAGVCYVGRLSAEKGVGTLLEAASRSAWHLTVAGDGPLRRQFEGKYAACGNIRFAGNLSADDVHSLLRRSRLSVMPSVCYDNNPLAVIESLCAGTPVAASAIGGLPELIDERNGGLFTPGDSESLADTVGGLLARDFDYNAIADSARRRFSPDSYYDALRRIYSDKNSSL